MSESSGSTELHFRSTGLAGWRETTQYKTAELVQAKQTMAAPMHRNEEIVNTCDGTGARSNPSLFEDSVSTHLHKFAGLHRPADSCKKIKIKKRRRSLRSKVNFKVSSGRGNKKCRLGHSLVLMCRQRTPF